MPKPTESSRNLAAYITDLRRTNGYTQQEVASYLHITPSAYANYEASRRSITPSCLLSLSQLYHRSADDFLREATAHYHTGQLLQNPPETADDRT